MNAERVVPQPGEQWMHYSGLIFEVVGESLDDNLTKMVSYRQEGDSQVWTTTLEGWYSEREGGPRFRRVYPMPLYSAAWN